MAEDALRTVLTTVEALDADTCDYLVAGLLAAAEDEPGRVLTTELAAEFAAPFLDNVPESDAAALYLRLVAASTSDTGVCEATAQAESAGAQAARLAQLGLGEGAGAASSAHAPQLPKARGGGLRIGQLQVLPARQRQHACDIAATAARAQAVAATAAPSLRSTRLVPAVRLAAGGERRAGRLPPLGPTVGL